MVLAEESALLRRRRPEPVTKPMPYMIPVEEEVLEEVELLEEELLEVLEEVLLWLSCLNGDKK